jgi:hypothetical protein
VVPTAGIVLFYCRAVHNRQTYPPSPIPAYTRPTFPVEGRDPVPMTDPRGEGRRVRRAGDRCLRPARPSGPPAPYYGGAAPRGLREPGRPPPLSGARAQRRGGSPPRALAPEAWAGQWPQNRRGGRFEERRLVLCVVPLEAPAPLIAINPGPGGPRETRSFAR